MMTVKEALDIRQCRAIVASMAEMREAELVVVDFASRTLQMLDALACVSFPIPAHVRITCDPRSTSNELYITVETADRLHRALGAALAVQS